MLLEDVSQRGWAPGRGSAQRNRFTFASRQSWVHSQGKHFSGCFPGRTTSSWFLVCRIWRTSSPCRVVRAGGGTVYISGRGRTPCPSLRRPKCAYCVSSTMLSLSTRDGSHPSMLHPPPIFSIFYTLLIELGLSLDSILSSILSEKLHEAAEVSEPRSIMDRNFGGAAGTKY